MSLSEQDREALLRAWPWPEEAATTKGGFGAVVAAVEQIVVNALTKAADAIEAEGEPGGHCMCEFCCTLRDAADIVRAQIPPP